MKKATTFQLHTMATGPPLSKLVWKLADKFDKMPIFVKASPNEANVLKTVCLSF
jgi:hypothetical protein